eukprot:m.38046 g.38046  ORF g.38046 m.38046 type:complete len:1533 (+) comp10154_c0_seq1:155-4753(+)
MAHVYRVQLPNGEQVAEVPQGELTVDALSGLCGFHATMLMSMTDFTSYMPNADGVFEVPQQVPLVQLVVDSDRPVVVLRSNVKPQDISRAKVLCEVAREMELADSFDAWDTQFVSSVRQADLCYSIAQFDDAVFVTFHTTSELRELIFRDTAVQAVPGLGTFRKMAVRLLASLPTAKFASFCLPVGDSRDQPTKRLVFCGAGVNGSLSHVAACIMRKFFNDAQGTELVVHAISFGSPSFVEAATAVTLHASVGESHLSVLCESDAVLRMLTVATKLNSAPRAMVADLCPRFLSAAAKLDTRFDEPLVANIKVEFASAVDLVQTYHKHDWLFLGVQEVWSLDAAPGQHSVSKTADEASAQVNRAQWSRENCRAHYSLHPLAVPSPCIPLPPSRSVYKGLLPTVSNVSVTLKMKRIEFTLEGTNLECMLTRISHNGAEVLSFADSLPISLPRAPLVFQDLQLSNPNSAKMFVLEPFTPLRAQVVIVGSDLASTEAPFSLVARTDFGSTEPFQVSPQVISKAEATTMSASLYQDVGVRILTTAWHRYLLLLLSQKFDFAHLYIKQLEKLEATCGIKPTIRTIADTLYRGGEPAPLDDLMKQLHPSFIHAMHNAISKPLNLQTVQGTSRIAHYARVGASGLALGVAIGFVVVGAVLALPAAGVCALLSEDTSFSDYYEEIFEDDPIAWDVCDEDENSLATRLAISALTLPALIPNQIGKHLGALSLDAYEIEYVPSQYMNTLQLLAQIFDVEQQGGSPTLPGLETAIYHQCSQDGVNLDTASNDEVSALLVSKASDEFDDLVESPDALSKLCTSARQVGHFHTLRDILSKHIWVNFIGVHNAGKSTTINKLFGCCTNADALVRTETPNIYNLTGTSPISDKEGHVPRQLDALQAFAVDLPGSTDQRTAIGRIAHSFRAVAAMTICVFSAGHIALPEQTIVNTVKRSGRPYLVVINKCDVERELTAETVSRYRTNYATVLEVPESLLLFTSVLVSQASVEKLRQVIFTALSKFVYPHEEPQLAQVLMHPTQFDTAIRQFCRQSSMPQQQFPREAVARDLIDKCRPATVASIAQCALSVDLNPKFKRYVAEAALVELARSASSTDAGAEHEDDALPAFQDSTWERMVSMLRETTKFSLQSVEPQLWNPQALRARSSFQDAQPDQAEVDDVDHSGASLQSRQQSFRARTSALIEGNDRCRIRLDRDAGDHLPSAFLNQLATMDAEDVQGGIRIDFINAETVDAGGPIRGVVAKCAEAFSKGKLEILQETSNGDVYFAANIPVTAEREMMFGALGRLLGFCLLHDIPCPIPMPLAVFKLLSHREISLADLEKFEPEVVRGLVELLKMRERGEDVGDVCLSFDGLQENGDDVDVTNNNLEEYLQLKIQHLLGIGLPLKQLLSSFEEICPYRFTTVFSPVELQSMICGLKTIDGDQLAAMCRFSLPSGVKQFMKTVVQQLSPEDCMKLVAFATGNGAIPSRVEEDDSPFIKFTSSDLPSTSLLVAHSCFNQVEVPPFPSVEVCRQKVLQSIRESDLASFELY